MPSKTADGLTKNSPFTHHFRNALSSVRDDTIEATEDAPNSMFNEQCFNVIDRNMHLFPLWSAVLRNQPEMLSTQNKTRQRLSEPILRSNAIVEDHFRQMKHGRLSGRKEFVRDNLQTLNWSTFWASRTGGCYRLRKGSQ